MVWDEARFNSGFNTLVVSLKVNRQRPRSVMQGPLLIIPALDKWLIPPLVSAVIKICKKHFMLNTNSNASINSKREHPPGQTPAEFFEVVKALPQGKIFPQKHGPGTKTPTPGEYFRRSSQPFLLIGVEILGFCRNQTLKRIGRLSNYSLVIPSSFSLSTILKVLKFPPSFEADFVTRW